MPNGLQFDRLFFHQGQIRRFLISTYRGMWLNFAASGLHHNLSEVHGEAL
jgi:hypothetical protein